jgi:hypothetical protein
LNLHLSLGTSSRVAGVLSNVVGYLEVFVPVCDMYREGLVVLVDGEGEWYRICSEGIGFALSSRT